MTLTKAEAKAVLGVLAGNTVWSAQMREDLARVAGRQHALRPVVTALGPSSWRATPYGVERARAALRG